MNIKKNKLYLILFSLVIILFFSIRFHNLKLYNTMSADDGGGHIIYTEILLNEDRLPTLEETYLAWHEPFYYFLLTSWIKIGSFFNLGGLNFWESLFNGYLITETIEVNQASAEVLIPDLTQDEEPLSIDFSVLLKRYPEIIDQESINLNNVILNLHKDNTVRTVQFNSVGFTRLGQHRQLIIESQSSFASQGRIIVESKGQPFDKKNPIKVYNNPAL